MANLAKLQEAGFTEIPKRELWFSRELRMAFSQQAIREMDPRWLVRHVAEKAAPSDFVFYFNLPPRDIQVCDEVLTEIGLPKLRANIRLASFVG
jgi:hypothetical protein